MTTRDIQNLAQELRALLARIDGAQETLSPRASSKLRRELESVAHDLRTRLANLDPVKMPGAFFDPADPRLFGTFAAVALIGQDRTPLSAIAETKFYGSGIYAIYYIGATPLYEPISGTETPIYVGKADPGSGGAKTPREQGTTLSGRLDEHRKNIERATNLDIADFECRRLVVASGWQTAAESALITLFRPLWNKETRILLGFGKHGDSGDTRRNKRSPWDVLHPGRGWAQTGQVEDAKSPGQIKDEVRAHFTQHPPVRDLQHVLHDLIARIGTI